MRFAAALLLALMTTSAVGRPTTRAFIATTQDRGGVESCEHFHTTSFTTLGAQVHGEERRLLSISSQGRLSVTASQAGGISIRGWNRPEARLTVCKFAAAATLTEARNVLGSVSVTAAHDGRISPRGPALTADRAWWVHMILEVPRATALELAAANGGIAVRNMIGRIQAQTTNGRISLASCIGEPHLQTEGGGILVDHAGGNAEMQEASGAGIHIHKADVEYTDRERYLEKYCRDALRLMGQEAEIPQMEAFQRQLLGRYRMADAETKRWVARTIADHVRAHIPELADA